MNYYSITGVYEGDHYSHVIKASSLSIAVQLFSDKVVEGICESFGLECTETELEGMGSPWVVSVFRSTDEPEQLRVA